MTFLEKTAWCLEQYFKENGYQMITTHGHDVEPWRTISVTIRLWPTGTAERDARVMVYEDGRVELHGHVPPIKFIKIKTNIIDPESFPTIDAFLDRVFP